MKEGRDYTGWTKYVWLIYLVPFVAYPFTDGRVDPKRIALTLSATVLFLVLYVAGYRTRGTSLLAIIGCIALLGVLFFPSNNGAGAFFIFAAGFAGGVGGSRSPFAIVAALVILLFIEVGLLRMPVSQWWWAVLFTIVVGAVNVHFAEVSRSGARLRLAHDEIEHLATMAERERIARDLHDLLGHTLSLIILKSELASKLAEREPLRAREEIRDVERISREALSEVRQAVRGYRGGGLAKEVEAGSEMLRVASVTFDFDVNAVGIPPSQEAILALALREAVTNVVRHSRATHCEVRLTRPAGALTLTISDNGRGGAASEGFGLSGMRERIEAIGGSVARDGSGGTTLTIALPAEFPLLAAPLERSA